MYLSKYFDDLEIICRHCYSGREVVKDELLRRLDQLRESYGRPIYVSCMFRCPEHNADVGGVPNSQHVRGTAADIYVDGDYLEFYEFVLQSRLFDGVGYYPNDQFVHVDIRNGGHSPNYYRW